MFGYTYEVWKTGKIIGYYWKTIGPLVNSEYFAIPEICPLKKPFRQAQKYIKFKIEKRVLEDNGIDITFRRYLNANWKTTRQIRKLLGDKWNPSQKHTTKGEIKMAKKKAAKKKAKK